jgi:hypothetical protein
MQPKVNNGVLFFPPFQVKKVHFRLYSGLPDEEGWLARVSHCQTWGMWGMWGMALGPGSAADARHPEAQPDRTAEALGATGPRQHIDPHARHPQGPCVVGPSLFPYLTPRHLAP